MTVPEEPILFQLKEELMQQDLSQMTKIKMLLINYSEIQFGEVILGQEKQVANVFLN